MNSINIENIIGITALLIHAAKIDEQYSNQEKTLIECFRILKKKGSLCWQVGSYFEKSELYPLDIFVYEICRKIGFKLRNRIIWHFEHGLHSNKKFSGRYETIMWFTKSDDYYFDFDDIRVPQKYPGKVGYKGKNKGKSCIRPCVIGFYKCSAHTI